jgi:hypothetical protein
MQLNGVQKYLFYICVPIYKYIYIQFCMGLPCVYIGKYTAYETEILVVFSRYMYVETRPILKANLSKHI